MFSGIVERIGRVARAEPREGGIAFAIRTEFAPGRAPEPGASVGLNGVCLTAERVSADGFTAFVVPETLRLTTLGGLREGSPVNLERALRVGDELGGHWVQGHVDGVGRVTAVERAQADVIVRIEMPEPLRRFVARKGSIAVDGTSLTVAGIDASAFTVALVPHTLANTIGGAYAPGDRVNLEVDLIARYLERLLDARRTDASERESGAIGRTR